MYLNCKTWFSYHYGTFSSKQLVEDARALDIHTLALTNINNTADSWDFVLKCREQESSRFWEQKSATTMYSVISS